MIKSSCKFIVILTWLKLIFSVFIFLTLLQTCQTSAYNESQKNPCLRKKPRKENFHDHSFLVIYRNKWCKYYLTLERHSIKSLQNQNNLHPPKKWITYFTISDVWWKMIKKKKKMSIWFSFLITPQNGQKFSNLQMVSPDYFQTIHSEIFNTYIINSYQKSMVFEHMFAHIKVSVNCIL